MTEYAERDAQALDRAGGHYCRHLNAMTAENLNRKSDIAAELAWRDMRIAELEARLKRREESELAAIMRMAEARGRERDAESARDIDRMLGMERGNEAQGQFAMLYKRCKDLEAQLVSADRYTLHALAGAGICTPAEGFREAGFNWAAHGIEELSKQRDEALARADLHEAELLRTSIPVDDFDRSEETTE